MGLGAKPQPLLVRILIKEWIQEFFSHFNIAQLFRFGHFCLFLREQCMGLDIKTFPYTGGRYL